MVRAYYSISNVKITIIWMLAWKKEKDKIFEYMHESPDILNWKKSHSSESMLLTFALPIISTSILWEKPTKYYGEDLLKAKQLAIF